jgi:hypothetical protein
MALTELNDVILSALFLVVISQRSGEICFFCR